MNTSEIKYYLRNTPGIAKIYSKYVNFVKGRNFNYGKLKKLKPKFTNADKLRISLVVPSFESDFVYGGLLTAIKIFKTLIETTEAEGRIIVLSGQYSRKSTFKIKGFDYQNNNLIFYESTNEIEIGKNDFFIGTFWTTAYVLMPLLQKQIEHFKLSDRKLVYLIQDFEPGFYPWSSEYVLADSTYKSHSENILAVFNAKSLYTYFKNNHYDFGDGLTFSPQLNTELAKYLPKKPTRRQKQILIYGRPRVERNAFEIIRAGISEWSKTYKNSKEWEIVSLGAEFADIKLQNNIIKSNGKVTLSEYAKYMSESYVGISLMVSPHPSYPPLEMSTFGVKTITNSFANKDLSNFNDNIYNINVCTPEEVSRQLTTICKEYEKNSNGIPYYNNEYVIGGDFDRTMISLSKKIKEMMER